MLASLGWAVRWGIPNALVPLMARPCVYNCVREFARCDLSDEAPIR